MGQNRTTPEMRNYYHHLADLIRISWELSKILIKDREIYYPGERIYHAPSRFIKTDFNTQLQNNKEKGTLFNVRDYIGSTLYLPLFYTQSLITGNQTQRVHSKYDAYIQHPYLHKKIKETNELALLYSKTRTRVQSNEEACHSVICAGLRTAASILPHLGLMVKNELNPITAILLSKTDINHIGELERLLGLHSLLTPILNTDSSILDPYSESGLNDETLKAFGFGNAIGCPASIPPSKECKEFLRSILPEFGMDPESELKGTMLAQAVEPAILLAQKSKHWFAQLSESDREIIAVQDRRLLEGDHLRNETDLDTTEGRFRRRGRKE